MRTLFRDRLVHASIEISQSSSKSDILWIKTQGLYPITLNELKKVLKKATLPTKKKNPCDTCMYSKGQKCQLHKCYLS